MLLKKTGEKKNSDEKDGNVKGHTTQMTFWNSCHTKMSRIRSSRMFHITKTPENKVAYQVLERSNNKFLFKWNCAKWSREPCRRTCSLALDHILTGWVPITSLGVSYPPNSGCCPADCSRRVIVCVFLRLHRGRICRSGHKRPPFITEIQSLNLSPSLEEMKFHQSILFMFLYVLFCSLKEEVKTHSELSW